MTDSLLDSSPIPFMYFCIFICVPSVPIYFAFTAAIFSCVLALPPLLIPVIVPSSPNSNRVLWSSLCFDLCPLPRSPLLLASVRASRTLSKPVYLWHLWVTAPGEGVTLPSLIVVHFTLFFVSLTCSFSYNVNVSNSRGYMMYNDPMATVVPAIPGKPTAVIVSVVTSRGAIVSWTDPDPAPCTITGYSIYLNTTQVCACVCVYVWCVLLAF